MTLIFDSTALIYFAKLKLLDKLAKLEEEMILPKSVYDEVVVEGKRKGKDDAFLVEKFVSLGILTVRVAKNEVFIASLLRIPSLEYADAETLALAKELSGVAILDETPSRAVADVERIEFHGSIFLLFSLFKKRLIRKNEIKVYIDGMIKFGWRCSTELYAAVMDEIEKL